MNFTKSFRNVILQWIGLMAINGMFFFCNSAQPAKSVADSQIASFSKIAKETSIQKDTVISKKNSNQEIQKIMVYYFHGDARCPTCFKLESYSKSEIESVFANAIKGGQLEWKSINIDNKGNEHFGKDYKLYTKSVIVSILQNGKEVSWKNLNQIWQLVQNEAAYREYIKKEVKACLEGKCL